MSMKNSSDTIGNHAIGYTDNLNKLAAKFKVGENRCCYSSTAVKGVMFL
jgi:hypothetical protein